VALATVLSAWCGERKVQDAFQVLDGAGVPCEVSDPAFSQTVYDDQELIARKWVVSGHHRLVGRIDMFGRGIDFSDTQAEPGGDPAVFGEHTREVMAEYGYTPEQIDAMVASGAVIAAEVTT
jgi:crotonobetainyl-CoA:carnitine CoA-transferase CaiB-like acyl-CoA transferase